MDDFSNAATQSLPLAMLQYMAFNKGRSEAEQLWLRPVATRCDVAASKQFLFLWANELDDT